MATINNEDARLVGKQVMVGSPWGILAHYYGPLAFGLVCVLLIWRMVMQPQLDAKNIDYEEHRKIVSTMQSTAAAMSSTAATMQSTSQVLERQSEVLAEILQVVREDRDERRIRHADP